MAISHSPASRGHLILVVYEAWGHTRPLCTLAAKFVKDRPIHITFFTTTGFLQRVKSEIRRSFDSNEAHLLDLIRVVGLPHGGPNPLDTADLDSAFADAYEKLVKSAPVTCVTTGVQYDSVPSPDVAIIDFFCLSPLQSIRKLSKKPVKIFDVYSGAASALHLFLPHNESLRSRVEREALRSGRPEDVVVEEIVQGVTGAVLNIPGLPPMFDHELQAQELPMANVVGKVFLMAYDIISACDGIVLTTPACLEPEAVAAARDFFAKTSRGVYVFGPLMPSGEHATQHEEAQSSKSLEIATFMNTILKSHGEHSLVYLSLGSVFWPKDPAKVWAFLDVLIEMKIPFVMSHASKFAVIPDTVAQKVKDYGLGILSPWSPQQTILDHPVTGWFVTHGGHNSVIESVTRGVPMIFWPFQADQPMNAAYLSFKLNAAYELFEVRDGHGLKTIHRLGKAHSGTLEAVRAEAKTVLENAFGEDGHTKRANVKKLKERVDQACSEDGEARVEFKAFLDLLTAE